MCRERMHMTAQMVGVIDGDNVAFAIVSAESDLRLESVQQFKTGEFPTFTDALQSYTRAHNLSTADLSLGLAVTGVARGDVISFANCRWYISVSGLRAFLGREPLVLNDFAATAWSLSGLQTSQMKQIGPVPPRGIAPGRSFLVVGTGPGLGAATLVIRDDGSPVVLESEGGHASFSPQTVREDALLESLRKRHGHVSFERLVSFQGLQNIHGWLQEQAGRPGAPPPPDQIIAAALRGDRLARDAAEMCASALGNFAGNMVLGAGAWDGLILVGPMLRQLMPILDGPALRNAFLAKGRMRKSLELVPSSFANGETASLSGAAAALRARVR
ncbi:MAG: glucokinase [Alphaproteobacteria bacterium]|nr:glucokinase [Alphaproteobacteria bacterium]